MANADHRYLAEVRVFSKAPADLIEMDYVSRSCSGDDYDEVLEEARWIAKRLGGKIKILLIDNLHKNGSWIIYTHTYTYKQPA